MRFSVRQIVFALIGWALLSATAHADATRIWVDFEQAGALGIAELVKSRAGNLSAELTVTDLTDPNHTMQNSLDVVVGRSALEQWLRQPSSQRVLTLLVTRYDWQQLAILHPELAQRGTALHVDPSPRAQLRLAQSISPNPTRVGLLIHEDADLLALGLDAEALQASELVVTRSAGSDEEIMQDLASLLEKSDALIAIPDARLYGPQNFRHVLLSAYRQRKPVIGFSGAGVRAGCLMAPYVNGEDLADAAIRRIRQLRQWPANRPLPPSQDLQPSEIRVNEEVAKTLGLQWNGPTGGQP
jgi:putative ABC transport system substrate-binding protein